MNDREKTRGGAGGNKYIYAGDFDYTLPRPPALGEERVYGTTERVVFQTHSEFPQKAASPVSKINYDIDEKPQFSTAGCLSWAKSLHNLLQDSDGVKLFLRYLESEGPQHADTLKFWFACEGLKNQNQMEKKQKLVKLIYKTYFLKSALPINDDLRKEITRIMKSQQCLQLPVTLFDEAQAQIEHLINKTTYPNFLKSDVYVEYLQSVDNVSDEESSSSNSSRDLGNLASGVGPLPTLHEEMEYHVPSQPSLLGTPGTASVSTGYGTPIVRLTKDFLLRSQKHRAYDKSKSETFANLISRHNGTTSVLYNGYYPVSRVDSERQSLSSHSDATTESDKLSLNERIIDGRISGRSKHKSFDEKQARHLAARHNETNMNFALIPRTQRVDHFVSKCMPVKEHAALLNQKLLNLQRQMETEELLNQRLKEDESSAAIDDKLETAMREKLQFQDDNDQNILDEHVSRVFSDHSLSISPDLASPKPASPPRGRWPPGNRCIPDSNNMSSLPMAPNTALQLEEIKRRLTEADGKSKSKHRSSKKYPEFNQQSRQSTLRKSGRSQRPSGPQVEDVTTVVIYFCDEQFPYLTKIPGSQTTLKQFKDYLPKKGNYRFFFKTVCEDLSNQVTHKEVTNDNEILPLWEGKIMAQVKPVD